MDHLAGTLALVATHRLARRQCLELVEPQSSQDSADGGGRDGELDREFASGAYSLDAMGTFRYSW